MIPLLGGAFMRQLPNVSFLAKQLFEISGSHIEIEHVFNLVGMLITL
jgi:hypothetical protein